MQTVLVTGGAGFIGSNFTRFLVQKGYRVTVLDSLDYSGSLENLRDILPDIDFIEGDICKDKDLNKVIKGIDVVVNFAAHTHVDKSIDDAGPFFRNNFYGAANLLESSSKNRVKLFIQISTDEVYGSISQGSFKESAELNPSSPYAITKALADNVVMDYFKNHSLPAIIVRPCNNYGPYQYPEKFVPLIITNLIQDKSIPVYGRGLNVREWIYVTDTCFAIELIMRKGNAGSIYNISSKIAKQNIGLVKMVLKKMDKGLDFIQYVQDRVDHDFRYSIDNSKLLRLGFELQFDLDKGLNKTIDWYLNNREQ